MIAQKLREVKLEVEFDILTVTDSKGRVIVRSGNQDVFGDDVSGDIYVKHVLEKKKSCYGSDIISRDELLKGEHGARDRALIHVIPTPRARKKNRQTEDRGLVLKAASPVMYNGKLIGVIYGAKLINNTFDLVDKFKNLVFKDEKIGGFRPGDSDHFSGRSESIDECKKNRRTSGRRYSGVRGGVPTGIRKG